MARAPKFSSAVVTAKADTVVALLDDGWLRLYDGGTVGKPATADTAITDQVLLSEHRFQIPAAPAAVDGVATFGALTGDSSANATGTASWFRTFQSDGTTVVFDGTVGISGADLNLGSVSIVATTLVNVPGVLRLTENKG